MKKKIILSEAMDSGQEEERQTAEINRQNACPQGITLLTFAASALFVTEAI